MLVNNEPIKPKKIRSFIRRQGRLTEGQQYALANYRESYCLNPERNYDFNEVFARSAPLIVEIGFGNGESLAGIAAANPDNNYIGIEVHTPGVGHLLMLLQQQGLTNVRVFCHDAVEILANQFPDNSLAGVHLFFPDPWPKTRHHKRRIVNPEFTGGVLNKKLMSGGYFHAATDWQPYAQAMLTVLSNQPGFKNASINGDYMPRPEYRPLTKFEQRGLRLGHGVWDLIFTKS